MAINIRVQFTLNELRILDKLLDGNIETTTEAYILGKIKRAIAPYYMVDDDDDSSDELASGSPKATSGVNRLRAKLGTTVVDLKKEEILKKIMNGEQLSDDEDALYNGMLE